MGAFRRWGMPLLLMLTAPLISLLLWVAMVHYDGSLLTMADAGVTEVAAHLPLPSWTAAGMLGLWLGLQLLLLVSVPGPSHVGPPTPEGHRPIYRLNGRSVFALTWVLLIVAAGPLDLFSPSVVYDRFGQLLVTSSLLAFVLCVLLYVKGLRFPSTSDAGTTGSPIRDLYWGTELHPTLFGIQLKQLFNSRFAMMGWSVIIVSFAAKQWETTGTISPGMAVNVGLQLLYITKFFYWEGGYFNSLDITHDRFGFYILWGVSAWLPSVYTVHTLYLVKHPGDLSTAMAILIGLLGTAAVIINYQADAQRLRVRQTEGRTTVWGHRPEIITAHYRAADGRPRHSLLLASGWWGVARHFHYVPEILLAVAWTLPVGFSHLLPWFYVIYLTFLLVDRAGRDDRRCAAKYGTSWDAYRQRVPYRMIPGLY